MLLINPPTVRNCEPPVALLNLKAALSSAGKDAQILDGALEVLKVEFPKLKERVNLQLPDEKSRRVGQAIAAASLPAIDQEV